MDPTVEAYNSLAEEYEAANGVSIWATQLTRFKQLLPQGKLIELGCGTGRDAVHFVNGNYEYLGIDASEKFIEIARKKVHEGTFRVMDFYQLDFPENTFDGFLAIASLLHIPKSRLPSFFSSIERIVKPESIGFITMRKGEGEGFRDIENPADCVTFCAGFSDRYSRKHRNPINGNIYKRGTRRYFSFYQGEEFETILKKARYQVLERGETREPDGTEWLYFFVNSPKK